MISSLKIIFGSLSSLIFLIINILFLLNFSKFIFIRSVIFTFSRKLSFNFKGFFENLCNISLHLSA